MREQVQVLEAKYEELYAARVTQQLKQKQKQSALPSTDGSDSSVVPRLQDRYTAAKEEMIDLRSQIETTKQKLGEYDLLEATLECYLTEFQRPASSSSSSSPSSPSTPQRAQRKQNDGAAATSPSSPFPQLTEATCQGIIKQSYQEIVNRKWTGRLVSSGAEMLGWTDQRYVDGATLHFSLSKSFPNLAKEDLMLKTWDILTTAKHMHTLQSSTLEVKILQVISNDIIVLQRRVHHAQLQTVTCVNLIVFRIRTESGYVVAYRTIHHPGYPRETDSELASIGMDDDGDDDASSKQKSGKEPKVRWIDTLQWFAFDDFVDTGDGSAGCHVLVGGKTDNHDVSYANFFLFEVVTYIIRWESAVACSRLLLPEATDP